MPTPPRVTDLDPDELSELAVDRLVRRVREAAALLAPEGEIAVLWPRGQGKLSATALGASVTRVVRFARGDAAGETLDDDLRMLSEPFLGVTCDGDDRLGVAMLAARARDAIVRGEVVARGALAALAGTTVELVAELVESGAIEATDGGIRPDSARRWLWGRSVPGIERPSGEAPPVDVR